MDERVTVSLVNGMHLQAFTPDFPEVIPLDSDESVGGQGLGHRPLNMLLVGLGGCMAMDVVSILRKKRQDFSDLRISFDVQRAEEHPKIFTRIQMHFRVVGDGVSEEALARALELSYTKYCPANAMLSQAAQIDYTYEIIPQAQALARQ